MTCPDILCRSRGGSGKERLPRVLLDVLDLFKFDLGRRPPQIMWCAQQIGQELSIRNTAANNRLEALCLLGFVERKRSGRRWFYFFVRGEVVA